MDWQPDTDATHTKRHPDSALPCAQVHDSLRAADARPVDDAFTDPFDPLPISSALDFSPEDDLAEKLLPELLDELDHAGLTGPTPADHPGGQINETVKGAFAQWGKARP